MGALSWVGPEQSGIGHAGWCQCLVPSSSPAAVAAWQGGSTPLHYAAIMGHEGCAKVLVEAKAPLDVKDKVPSRPPPCTPPIGAP